MQLDIPIQSSRETFVHIAGFLIEQVISLNHSIPQRQSQKIRFDAGVTVDQRQLATRFQSIESGSGPVIFRLEPRERVTSRAQILSADVRNPMRRANDFNLPPELGGRRLIDLRMRTARSRLTSGSSSEEPSGDQAQQQAN